MDMGGEDHRHGGGGDISDKERNACQHLHHHLLCLSHKPHFKAYICIIFNVRKMLVRIPRVVCQNLGIIPPAHMYYWLVYRSERCICSMWHDWGGGGGGTPIPLHGRELLQYWPSSRNINLSLWHFLLEISEPTFSLSCHPNQQKWSVEPLFTVLRSFWKPFWQNLWFD